MIKKTRWVVLEERPSRLFSDLSLRAYASHAHCPEICISMCINTHIRTLTYWKRRGGAYMRRAWIHRTAKASEKDSHSSCLTGFWDYS